MITDSDHDPRGRNRFTATLWGFRLIWQAYPRLMLGMAVCTLFRGVSPAAFAMAIRGLINAVTATMNTADSGIEVAMFWLLIAFAVTIADSVAGLASNLLSDRLKSNLTLDVNSMVMQHAVHLDMPYIENTEHREVLERVRQNPGEKLHLLFIQSQRAVVAGFQVISLAGILTWLEPAVLLFALILAVPFMIFQWQLSRRRYLTEYQRTGKRRWTGYFLSRLTSPAHAGEVKLLGIGDLLTNRFIANMKEFRDQDHKLQLRQFGGETLFVTVTTIAFYALFGRVIIRAVEGDLSIGDLAIFGGAVVRLRSALETGIQFVARAYEQTLYVTDLRKFLLSKPLVNDSGTAQPAIINGALAVENICFAYPGSDEITLHDISFEIGPGETVAIVGENGSGKSTLAKLLARLYDVDAGTIKLDGKLITDYPLAFLHAHIALLGQSFGRYEASLVENIAYGDWERLATDRDAVEKLAAATGVDHIASGLPQGLDTQLGREFAEHDLSGGQWQLLAIARTLAKRASVLILDEPTSNIDARAEHALYAAIDQIAAGITTIIISHRFSTISMADRIVVMDEGRVVEQGTHRELMSAGGHYASLYKLHEHYRMKDLGVF